MILNDHSILLYRDYYWVILDCNHDNRLEHFPTLKILSSIFINDQMVFNDRSILLHKDYYFLWIVTHKSTQGTNHSSVICVVRSLRWRVVWLSISVHTPPIMRSLALYVSTLVHWTIISPYTCAHTQVKNLLPVMCVINHSQAQAT